MQGFRTDATSIDLPAAGRSSRRLARSRGVDLICLPGGKVAMFPPQRRLRPI
jgi:hypothetical protein